MTGILVMNFRTKLFAILCLPGMLGARALLFVDISALLAKLPLPREQ